MRKVKPVINIYYFLKGKKIIACDDLIKWAQWMEDSPTERIVKYTTIGDQRVSTVFLGIDDRCAYGNHRDPILFETMIFNKDGTTEDFQERYCTYDEALEGHNNAVKALKKRLRKKS